MEAFSNLNRGTRLGILAGIMLVVAIIVATGVGGCGQVEDGKAALGTAGKKFPPMRQESGPASQGADRSSEEGRRNAR